MRYLKLFFLSVLMLVTMGANGSCESDRTTVTRATPVNSPSSGMVNAIPEPSSALLFALGGLTLWLGIRIAKRKAAQQ